VLGAALVTLLAAPVVGQQPDLSARIWLDRGEDALLRRGETARLYYRTAADAYVAIFQIDTNGTTQLLFPRSPEENHYVRAGRDYRLLFPESTVWYVQDDPGMGYFFVIASPEPFDFRDFRYSHFEGGWDLSFAGRHVYSDPYVAMDDFVSRLIPDWEYVPYALDFVSYDVEGRHDYPRFLCYDCHGFRPYSTWNPYYSTCTTFRVVIYDDPYYYPAQRYRGDRVVFVRPPNRGLPRFEFMERGLGEQGTPLVISRPADADRPAPGTSAPRRSITDIGSGGRAAPPAVDRGSGATLLRGRPSQVLPGRGASPPRGTPLTGTVRRPNEGAVTPPGGPDRTRPVLQRRPPTRPGGGGPPAQARPPARRGGGGGDGGSVGPPPTRPPTGGARPVPTVRKPGGGGSPPAARPATRGSGGAQARPPVRKPGGGATPPATRTRRPGGGGAAPARPVARPSMGSSPPTRSAPARPPIRKPRGGGGGAGPQGATLD
jgi:hypothetical protein